MVLEKKFVRKQLAPLRDPLSIAFASMSNMMVRSLCISPTGLLIVPHVLVHCGCGEDQAADQTVKCLPAIDKAEVTTISCVDYHVPNCVEDDEPRDHDHFALCVGWLLGPFAKLRVASLATCSMYSDCCALERLDCYCS